MKNKCLTLNRKHIYIFINLNKFNNYLIDVFCLSYFLKKKCCVAVTFPYLCFLDYFMFTIVNTKNLKYYFHVHDDEPSSALNRINYNELFENCVFHSILNFLSNQTNA